MKNLTFEKPMNVLISVVTSLESKTFILYKIKSRTFQKRINVCIRFVMSLESNIFIW